MIAIDFSNSFNVTKGHLIGLFASDRFTIYSGFSSHICRTGYTGHSVVAILETHLKVFTNNSKHLIGKILLLKLYASHAILKTANLHILISLTSHRK